MRFKDIVSFAFLIATISTFVRGYTYGCGDDVAMMPIELRYLDPSYCIKDYFVNATTLFGPRFYFSKLLAILGTHCPTPAVHLVLTWLSNIGISLITCLVARSLFSGNSLIMMTGASLVMSIENINPGDAGSLFSTCLSAQNLAMPFALVSLWSGIKQKPVGCATAAACASLLHPLVGVFSGLIGLLTGAIAFFLPTYRHNNPDTRRGWVEIMRFLTGVAILGITALLAWAKPTGASINTSQFIDIIGYFRHPHHYIPSTFTVGTYITTILFLTAFAISWRQWYDNPSTDKVMARRILVSVIIVLILCFCGYLFVEVFPTRFWTTAQVFRLFFIVRWLGFIVIARMLVQFIMAKRILNFVLLALAAGILMHRHISYVIDICFLVVFIAISFWFLFFIKKWYGKIIPLLFLCAIMLIFAIDRNFTIPFLSRYLKNIRPVITLADLRGPDAQIAFFVRDHIREDAVFFTPPLFGQFRITARRAIVVDFKWFPFHDMAMVEWRRRLSDCYGDVKSAGFKAASEMDRSYRVITDEKLVYIAKRYGVSYAVLYKETPSRFPTLFENDTYKIVEIISGAI